MNGAAIGTEPEDLELSPFNQRGGLGRAHPLFGAELPTLLEELNNVLAARALPRQPQPQPAQEKPWTQKLWIYDLRTNLHFTLK